MHMKIKKNVNGRPAKIEAAWSALSAVLPPETRRAVAWRWLLLLG
jgi:hypothetical protein